MCGLASCINFYFFKIKKGQVFTQSPNTQDTFQPMSGLIGYMMYLYHKKLALHATCTYYRYTMTQEHIYSVLYMTVHKHSYFDELIGGHDVSLQHLSELRAHHYKTIVTAAWCRATYTHAWRRSKKGGRGGGEGEGRGRSGGEV